MNPTFDYSWMRFYMNPKAFDAYFKDLLAEVFDIVDGSYDNDKDPQGNSTGELAFDLDSDSLMDIYREVSDLMVMTGTPFDFSGLEGNSEDRFFFNGRKWLSQEDDYLGEKLETKEVASAILNGDNDFLQKIVKSDELTNVYEYAWQKVETSPLSAFCVNLEHTGNPAHEKVFWGLIDKIPSLNVQVPGKGGDLGLYLSEYLDRGKGVKLATCPSDNETSINRKRYLAGLILELPDGSVYMSAIEDAKIYLEESRLPGKLTQLNA